MNKHYNQDENCPHILPEQQEQEQPTKMRTIHKAFYWRQQEQAPQPIGELSTHSTRDSRNKHHNQNENCPHSLLETAGTNTTTKLSAHLTGAAGTSTVTEMENCPH